MNRLQAVIWVFLVVLSSAALHPSPVFGSIDSIVVHNYLKAAGKLERTNPDSALKLADKAYQKALKSTEPGLLADAYGKFASIYYYSGNLQLAIDYNYKALSQLEETTGDKESPRYLVSTAKTYCNIGNCYFDLKMIDMALTQYEKSLSIIDETNKKRPGIFTPMNRMLLLHNTGNILAERKDFEKAKQYYRMAEKINQSVGDMQVKAGLLESMGVILMKESHPDEAYRYFTEAMEVREQQKDMRGIVGTYIFLGDYFSNRKQVTEAEQWYRKAIHLGKQTARWTLVQIAADSLTHIYLAASDYKNAFAMNLFSNQLNDSVFNNRSEANLTRTALQFEFDRQIKNQELKQQKEINSQKNRVTFFIFLSTVFLLSSILVVLLFLNQRKKLANAKLRQKHLDLESTNIRLEREKLESELVQKNKELTTNVMYLVQKNEFITDIAQRTKELISRPPDQAKEAFNALLADLQRNTDDKVWKEFEVRFQDVHQDFYRRLNERFPDLTPNEKKLAAFLRLNMSTKDISAITFQSPDSIRIARSRLRKKLELPSDDNLIGFLESI